MDKLIRELLINVKQQGATKVTKSLQNIVDGLEDAAAGAELTNEQLARLVPTLGLIERNAKRAGQALGTITLNKGLSNISSSLSRIENLLDELTTSSINTAERMEAGFKGISSAATQMGNNIAAAIEKSEDHMIDLNRAVRQTGKGFGDTTNSATKVTRAVGDTSGAARGATRDFAAMAKVGGGLPILYAAIASNLYVLQSAFEQLKMGDQLNRLERFGSLVGSMTGTPVQALAIALQDAVNGAISFQEAMQQASVASTYGFNTEQISQFGLVARRASAVLGIDMVDALNRVIKGVSKQEIELLDELGVTIRLNDAYAKYVQVLNSANTGITYNINTLNTYQKQQAYANAVIEDSTKKLGQLDSALRATGWEQFAANANAALRSIQQSAASFLDPVIDRINTVMNRAPVLNQIATSQAAIKSINTMDANNANAVLNAYNNAIDRNKTLAQDTTATMALIRSNEAQIAKLQEDRNKLEGTSIGELGLSWDAYRAKIGAMIREEDSLVQMNKQLSNNIEEASKNATAFNMETAAATSKLKENKTLWNQISDSAGNVDPVKLRVALDAANASASAIKNDIPGINGLLGDQTSSLKNSLKISTGLSDIISTIKNNAAATGRSEEEVLKTYNLQYKTMDDLKNAQSSYAKLAEVNKVNSADALAVEQKIADVYASTKDKEKAQQAGRDLEIKQLDDKLARLREAQSLGLATKEVQDEINKLETEKLKTQNQGMEATQKVKDVSDKIVGIERQIELAKDNQLTSNEYNLENLKTQRDIELDRQVLLQNNAKKLKDYMNSKLQEAQIERQIRELNFSMLEVVSKRNRDQDIALRNASQEYGTQETIANQILDLERERLELIENSRKAKVALDTDRATDLTNQVAVLRKQLETERKKQNVNNQNAVTNLLGGTYSSTAGMTKGGEQETIQNYLNNQQGYAQAISNLQGINSEATAAGQSLGNMVNALMHFSKGSIDTTTMVAAGMQTVSSFISMATSQQVSAIDAAIQAEQARDGQSEESKAKIKKLEAEKIKVQQESAKKQILIQTAVAVMQAATSVPYPWSIPLMIAAAAVGALSLAQASSATPQLDGLSSSASTTGSLSLGDRDKSINVAQSSNAGEVSYIRGESGTGSANTFVPRANGGNMIPGVGYVTGENGIEVITPSVPSVATPASEVSSSSSSNTRPINLTIQAMDAASFRDFAINNQTALNDAVEAALNEKGLSLKTLGRG